MIKMYVIIELVKIASVIYILALKSSAFFLSKIHAVGTPTVPLIVPFFLAYKY
jgi:hypothetical protein